MPTNTYTPLATITLASTDSEIVFASIPATYRDLIMVANFSYSGGSGDTILRVNGDSSSIYNAVWMNGTGSAAQSGNESSRAYINPLYSAGAGRAVMTWQLLDYAATDKHKTSLIRTSTASGSVVATAGRWASTSAITSITIRDFASDTFAIGSTFSLYGVIA